MIKHILLFFLFTISFRSFAFNGDSLKLSSLKHTIDLSFGGISSLDKYKSVIYYVQANDELNKYSYSSINTISSNYGFRINKKTKKSLVFLGLGLNFTFFDVTETLTNAKFRSPSGYQYYTYPNNKIKFNIRTLSLSSQIEHVRFFGNFLILQKIGINYTTFLNKKKIYYYEEQLERSEMFSDSSYIELPGNPDGNYFKSVFYTSTRSKKMRFFDDYVTPFYCIGFGYKIKYFTPFINAEVSLFNFEIAILKYQAGVKLLF